jgi:hypothetical protein
VRDAQEVRRQQALNAFYTYCREQESLDPTTERILDEPALTHALNHFTYKVVQHKNDTKGASAPVIAAERIDAEIDRHFVEFHLFRHSNGRKSDRELDAIEEQQRKIRLTEFIERPLADGEEAITGRARRFQAYPQISLTMQMRDIFMDTGNRLGVDSAEVLLAAQGRTFPAMLPHMKFEVQSQLGSVIRTIPEDPSAPQ